MADPYAAFSSPAAADPYAAIATPTAQPKKKVGRSEGVAQAFGSGALFNFGDEATAAVRAAAPGFSNWMMSGPALQRDESIGGSPTPQTVSTAPTYGERYNEELTRERDKAKSFSESNPVLATGANIAGNVAGAAATIPALPAGIVARSVSPVVNVLKSAGTGAAYGGVAGYGAGEGENRAGNALLGAGVGAVVGGATPPIAAAGRRLMETGPGRYISDKIITPTVNALTPGQPVARSLSAAADGGNLPPSMLTTGADEVAGNAAQRAAIERIATDMQRSGRSPESFLRLVDRYGPETVLADLDPQLLRTATGVKVLPGETRTRAENVLVSRDRQAGNRVVRSFEGDEPPPSTFDLMKGMDANRSAVGADVYGTMRGEKLKLSAEMQDLLKTPAVRDALTQIEADVASTGTNLTPIEVAHRVKQKLNDTAEAAFASGKPVNKADLRSLAGRWEAAFGDANPTARAADQAYAKAASLPDYMIAGRNFLAGGQGEKAVNSSAPALADLLGSANTQQVVAARAGSTNAAREVTGGRNALSQTRALTRDIEMSPMIRDKLVELYGPRRATEIMQRAETENVFANTSNRLLRGSQTAEKLSDAGDVGGLPLPTGASPTNLLAYAKAFGEWVRQPNEAIRDEIGRALINPSTAENRRILQMAADLVARRRGNGPIRAGLSEGAGNVTRD